MQCINFFFNWLRKIHIYILNDNYFKSMRKELTNISPYRISFFEKQIIRISTCYLSKHQAICWIVLNSLSLSIMRRWYYNMHDDELDLIELCSMRICIIQCLVWNKAMRIFSRMWRLVHVPERINLGTIVNHTCCKTSVHRVITHTAFTHY